MRISRVRAPSSCKGIDAYVLIYPVLGERIITPGAIVQLVIQARAIPPGTSAPKVTGASVDENASSNRDERHQNFIVTKKESEDIPTDSLLAHTPRWPEVSNYNCASIPCSD